MIFLNCLDKTSKKIPNFKHPYSMKIPFILLNFPLPDLGGNLKVFSLINHKPNMIVNLCEFGDL